MDRSRMPPAKSSTVHPAISSTFAPEKSSTLPPAKNAPDYKALVTEALVQIDKLQRQVDDNKRARHEPIALVGMGCRFPGGANTPEAYWQMILDKHDGISEASQRWDMSKYYDPDPSVPGKFYSRHLGMIDNITGFDADFFSISPREAESMDPQQRLLLEVSWHALEQAGYTLPQLKGSRSGVFIGIGMQDYSFLRSMSSGIEDLSPYDGTGNALSVAAGRLSYVYGLRGPSMAIETACSSSLVAVHLAINALRNGECDMALAGGVNLAMNPATSVIFSKAMLLSPDGRCRTFDKSANGYVRADGCGVIVLKRLSDAVKAGDDIIALIRGSAVNQDGRSQGITAPNETAQQEVIQSALNNAQVNPQEIDYIEAHGTGTALGDPIEVNALSHVYSNNHDVSHPLYIGSVKTNIGHSETAAGIAGLIKTALALKHGIIPPQLHFNTPNPYIEWQDKPIRVVTEVTPWQNDKRFAGVSSFGFSGTNAHVILQNAPTLKNQPAVTISSAAISPVETDVANPCLLTLSATTPTALHELAQTYHDALSTAQDVSSLCIKSLRNRGQHVCKLTITGTDRESLQTALSAYLQNAPLVNGRCSYQERNSPRIAFLFPGQGSQFPGMGQTLYKQFKPFKTRIDACDAWLQQHAQWSLTDVLWGDRTALLLDTQYQQVALFAVQMACADLWIALGVKPQRLLSHSVGEYAAACLAGVFTWETALHLLWQRGQLSAQMPVGRMIAVQGSLATLREWVSASPESLSIAAINATDGTATATDGTAKATKSTSGNTSLVIAGCTDAIESVIRKCEQTGIASRSLPVSAAFHSPLVDPIIPRFQQILSSLTFNKPRIPVISSVTGKLIGDDMARPEYWVQHLRQPVLFADGFHTLMNTRPDALLEMGAGTTLLSLCRQMTDTTAMETLASLRKQGDGQEILNGAIALHHLGINIQWAALYPQVANTPGTTLPRYPFQRRMFWFTVGKQREDFLYAFSHGANNVSLADTTTDQASSAQVEMHSSGNAQLIALAHQARLQTRRDHSLFHRQHCHPLLNDKAFEIELNFTDFPLLKQHKVFNQVVVAGGFYISAFLAALQQIKQGNLAAWQLENIEFVSPLLLTETTTTTTATTLHILLSRTETGYTIEACTLAPEKKLYCKAHAVYATDSVSIQRDSINRYTSADAVIERDSFYPLLCEHTQLLHGTDFQWIDRVWADNMGVTAELLAPPGVMHNADIALPTGLIDSCFQSIAAVALQQLTNPHNAHGNTNPITAIPKRIARLRLYQPIGNQRCWSRADVRELTSDNACINISVNDVEQNPLLDIEGFVLQQVDPALLSGEPTLPATDYYEIRWHTLPVLAPELAPAVPAAAAQSPLGHTLILLPPKNQMTAALESWLTQLHPFTRALTCWHAMEEDTDTTPNLTNIESLRNALLQMRQDQKLPETVIHATASTNDAHAGQVDAMTLLQLHCGSLLALLQCLPVWTRIPPQLFALTQGAYPEGLQAKQIQPAHAALAGMLKSVSLEHAELNLSHWDIDENAWSSALLLNEIVARCRNQGDAHLRDAIALLRNETTLAPRLHPVVVDTDNTNKLTVATSNMQGWHIITGGLGDIGFVTCQWLIAQGAQHIALWARKLPNETQTHQIQQWIAEGIHVLVQSVDISDQARVDRALIDLDDTGLPVCGVMHTAGRIHDGLLQTLRWDDFVPVLEPKVLGSDHLAQALSSRPHQYFICFSSMASLMGNAGQTAYAAANAYMDALSQQRARAGFPGKTLHWGPWGEIGLAARMAGRAQSHFQNLGITPLKSNIALRHLQQFMQDMRTEAAVLPITWQTFLPQWPKPKEHGLFADIAALLGNLSDHSRLNRTLISKLHAMNKEERHANVLDYLHKALAQVLTRNDIDLDQSVLNLGIDSLMAMEFRARLKQELALEIPATQLLEGPSIRRMADILCELLTDEYFQRLSDIAISPLEEDGVDIIGTAALLTEATTTELEF